MTKTKGLLALSPVLLFIFLYLVISIIMGDFYVMPLPVALLVASIWAVAIDTDRPLTQRIELFSKEAGNYNIIYMIWIFILAGAFASLAKETGAIDAMVAVTLKVIPDSMLIPGIFIAACLISLSIGTSVGTVVALTPLAVELAHQGSTDTALFVAVVIGGAFFGDNLSFISDTTIAATRTQGIKTNEKFKANLRIALPAALITLIIYIFVGANVTEISSPENVNMLMIVPYLLIIVLALTGMNVVLVLTCGIIAAFLLALFYGHTPFELAGYMGKGIDGMGELIIITLLATGMLGMVKAMGGIDYLLKLMTRKINGSRGAQALIAILVGLVNLCTANNTVAILTTGNMARDISTRFGVDPRKTASILDTAACIIQCVIPYGAQMLLATGLAGISAEAPLRYLYYPWVLTAMLIISIIIKKKTR
jgi:Na+/H+ antiporter NhaC